MRTDRNARSAYTLFAIFLAAMSYLTMEVSRTDTQALAVSYGVLFFCYLWMAALEQERIWALFGLGVAARVVLFFSLPSLSDDFYRFLWDGHLVRAGTSPYVYIPSDALAQGVPGVQEELFSHLNSSQYFSVYPPLNQALFWLGASVGNSWLMGINVLRFILAGADIGSFFILRSLLGSRRAPMAAWYFLNPLLILEGTGNLHFEGLVIFFVLLALYFLRNQRMIASGTALGLAISTKLLPLLFLPAFFWKTRWRDALVLTTSSAFVAFLTFLPMAGNLLQGGMGDGLSLYFQSFEFNASFYYLFREIGYWLTGYNIIQVLGPRMAVLAGLLVLFWTLRAQYHKVGLATSLLFALTLYLLLATTVHPWYILPLIPLGLIGHYYFPVAWSFVIFATYFGYQAHGYEVPAWWIAAEYIVVLSFMLVEIVKKQRIQKDV
ncbi:MAG: DUF2029 domain-containing protein [Cyclobacteriaceae bacterium]|nr:DUF2029 domain-containing protein [Cyclobacteriaceae bacterium]